ncbi:helix-turn-helix transcriptional regulator [Caldilinea sp.]|uniref:helix-turn-helix transcriptional regulator n=1 Tax=Caldilinea sp. TaxID=2293560 RepID=UPI0021DCD2DC|nr:helix-turn-helix transcriptional regulator [Caldilinea sp.]GIV73510.1 MAG: hypothetical protein KatS3mg049_2066 [Caldilinea sp.]
MTKKNFRFGTSLRAMRCSRGLSQQELGQAVGVAQTTISSIENGIKLPSMGLAFRLASYFGTTVDAMAQGQVEMPEEDARPLGAPAQPQPVQA